MILMLEDNAERIVRFTETCRAIDPALRLVVWRDAPSMIREVGDYLSEAKLLSLDHDLEPEADGDDPGDGVQVVKFLVSQSIVRPVVIHSSNGERAQWMAGDFDLEGWRWYRISPLFFKTLIINDLRRFLLNRFRRITE